MASGGGESVFFKWMAHTQECVWAAQTGVDWLFKKTRESKSGATRRWGGTRQSKGEELELG